MYPHNKYERLTNVCYAADILLFAKSLGEHVYIVELLIEIFREFGFELISSNINILYNKHLQRQNQYIVLLILTNLNFNIK